MRVMMGQAAYPAYPSPQVPLPRPAGDWDWDFSNFWQFSEGGGFDQLAMLPYLIGGGLLLLVVLVTRK